MADEVSREELLGRVEGLRLLSQVLLQYYLTSVAASTSRETAELAVVTIRADIMRNKEMFRASTESDEIFYGFDCVLDSFEAGVRNFRTGFDEIDRT